MATSILVALAGLAGVILGQNQVATIAATLVSAAWYLSLVLGFYSPPSVLLGRLGRRVRRAYLVVIGPLVLVATSWVSSHVRSNALSDKVERVRVVSRNMQMLDKEVTLLAATISSGDLQSARQIDAALDRQLAGVLAAPDIPIPDDVYQLTMRWKAAQGRLARSLAKSDSAVNQFYSECGRDPRKAVSEHLKATANDPDSIEVLSCSAVTLSLRECYIEVCRFRERNRYGALVLREGQYRVRQSSVVPVDGARDVADRQ